MEGLQDAARLASLLDLQARCGAVFAQLAAASCQQQLSSGSEFTSGGSSASPGSASTVGGVTSAPGGIPAGGGAAGKASSLAAAASGNKPLRMHASHALSLDVVLTRSLEMGSQAPDCWRHVFRCCSKVASLERAQFCSAPSGAAGIVALRSTGTLARTAPPAASGPDLEDMYGVHAVPNIAP